MLELLHIFSPCLTNEVKFGFNRSTDNTYNSSAHRLLVPDRDFLRAWAGLRHTKLQLQHHLRGQYIFRDRQPDLAARPANVESRSGDSPDPAEPELRAAWNRDICHPGDAGSQSGAKASLTGALPVNDLRKTDIFGYVQDEFKLRPNFTLNLGARYTVFQLFHEAHGKANPFDFDTCGPQGFCGLGASFGQQNYGDFDPRVGLAWSPGQRRKDGRPRRIRDVPRRWPAGRSESSRQERSSLLLCDKRDLSARPVLHRTGTISPNAEQRNRKDSYVEQWDLSVQRELPANFVSTISYLGSHGVHLLETNVVNLSRSGTGLAQYPDFAPAIGWRGSVGASSYNGLSVSVRRPFTHGLLVAANYAYTHEIDNGSNGSGDGDEISSAERHCVCPANGPAAHGTPATWSMATPSISSPSAWASRC